MNIMEFYTRPRENTKLDKSVTISKTHTDKQTGANLFLNGEQRRLYGQERCNVCKGTLKEKAGRSTLQYASYMSDTETDKSARI